MKRILLVSEFSELSTGYAVYSKQLLSALHKAGFECLELARYADPKDPRVYKQPWKVIPVLPNSDNEQEVQAYKSNPLNVFGLWKFDHACLAFKPHIVLTISDFWMDQFIDFSPARKYFNWKWLITVDAKNQNEEWLDIYSRVDSLFTYNYWSKQQIEKESILKIEGVTGPPVNPVLVPIPGVKKRFNLDKYTIFGTVMRNQKRKLFPNLFNSFRTFLNDTQRNDILLYCHTSYPDQGWDIPKLLMEYDLGSKVLFSYVCRNCQYFQPQLYSDSVTICPQCKNHSFNLANVKVGISTSQLSLVYNLMDLYLQIASAEGFGIPLLEAAKCGIPVCATDYSAMSDVVRRLNGYPIKVLTEEMEVETGRLLAVPDMDSIVNYMYQFINFSESKIKELKEQTLIGSQFYNYDKMINVWIDSINKVDFNYYEQLWKSPPNIKKFPGKIPDLPNKQYIDWLILNVLQDKNKINSYFAVKWLKHLNYGLINSDFMVNFMDDVSFKSRIDHRPIDKKEVFDYMYQLAVNHNNFEYMRTNNA